MVIWPAYRVWRGEEDNKDWNVLFNDAFNLWLYDQHTESGGGKKITRIEMFYLMMHSIYGYMTSIQSLEGGRR